MTRVDFYILEDDAAGDRFALTCRLTEKAWRAGHRVYIHTDDGAAAARIDELLWTFREQGFIPHGLAASADKALNPVLIGHQPETDEHDLLINLARETPAFFSQFERVLEPVDRSPEQRDSGRARYRFYRDRGYPLDSHKIAH